MVELNRQNLADEFNTSNDTINEMEVLEPEIVYDDNDNDFEKEWDKEQEPEQILRDSIDRANTILDRIDEELVGGNFSARLVEVAGQLLNSITASVKEIQSERYNKKYIKIRNRLVELKKYEIELKQKQLSKPPNQNLIIADRESVLKFLENKKEKEEKD